MPQFKNSGGIMDVIRCDEPDYLIWKWRPAGAGEKSGRANAIRWGSSLRVRDGSVAVFVYPQRDGLIEEYIEGPADTTLSTKNLPVLTSLLGALYNGESPFQAEIYFINLAKVIQVKFGVPYFDLFDPRFPDFGVPTAVRGSINFSITDYRAFIELHRLEQFDLEMFQRQIRDAVVKTVKSVVANAPEEHGIPVVQLERKISTINDLVEEALKERLGREFGVSVSSVDISAMELDKQSEGYSQLKQVTVDMTTAAVQAKTKVDIQRMQDAQRIEAEHLEETLRAQREEAQYAQRLQTQSEHLTTHQLNQQAAVGIAGAEALGKMGAGGSMDAGGGMNPGAMMAGMAMGGAIGQNMAGMMSGMMAGMSQPVGTVPPPLPALAYYVAVDRQATGPFDAATLKSMAAAGTLSKTSLIWKSGMESWVPAGEVPELESVLAVQTPPGIEN